MSANPDSNNSPSLTPPEPALVNKKPLYVTSSFLPDLKDFQKRLEAIWESNQLTNNGQMVRELEQRLTEYLDVKHVILVSNGDAGLRIGYKALGLTGEVITTPFSYVSTTSSLIWSGLKPVFADIEPKSLTIDPSKIEDAITDETSAILATHVFGFPCQVEAIQEIADRYSLKVIYDAAHAFGISHRGQSILSYGDLSMVSLHATKLFHCGEGGLLATNNDEIAKEVEWRRRFGHLGQEAFHGVGVNAKMSEFHGAMGLCVLDCFEDIHAARKSAWHQYVETIESSGCDLAIPEIPENTDYNFAYFPVLFPSEASLLKAFERLKQEEIYPRRYFYPSLNTVEQLGDFGSCPVSEDIASRIACLPFSAEISPEAIERIIAICNEH